MGTVGPLSLGTDANRKRLAREMLSALPSRSAPWLSKGTVTHRRATIR